MKKSKPESGPSKCQMLRRDPFALILSFGLFRSICHSREACARAGGVAGIQ